MIAKELEIALHRAFVNARAQRHRHISVDHLLLAMLDTPSAVRVLKGCGAELDALAAQLAEHVGRETQSVPGDKEVDTQPTLGFQRVIQRAILKVQSAGKREVAGEDVLVAAFAEKDSYAVRLLASQNIGWLEATSFISHGGAVAETSSSAPDTDVQVVIYNDEYTPMQFVVDVLEGFFGMSSEDAKETMLEVHREGAAVCGLYTRAQGELLVAQVAAHVRAHGYPLRCATATPE